MTDADGMLNGCLTVLSLLPLLSPYLQQDCAGIYRLNQGDGPEQLQDIFKDFWSPWLWTIAILSNTLSL